MILLKGDKGNIDFQSQIVLSEEQRERLLNFLREMFYHVEEKEVTTFRFERLGSDNPFNKEWEPEEFELLLKIDAPNLEVSRKLGRTWMSVEMKRVWFIPEMMKFASLKGTDIYKTDIKKLVKEYIKEHQDEITKRKEERRATREEIRELKQIIDTFEQKEKMFKILVITGKAKERDFEDIIKEKQKAESRLKELSKEGMF